LSRPIDGFSLLSTSTTIKRWIGDFFSPTADARICALMRIAYAALVIVYLVILYPDWHTWYGNRGLVPKAIGRQVVDPDVWSLLFLIPDGDAGLNLCFWLMSAQAVLLLLGLWSRVQALSLFVWWLSLHHRNILILDGEDTLIRLLAFYLSLMPIGAVWSLDRWLASRWRPAAVRQHVHVAGWGVRLLQLQMVFILISAGLSKLNGETWVAGTALYYVARLDDYFGRFYVPDFLFDQPAFVAAMTWSVMAMELLPPALIWFRKTRPWVLGALLVFHLANDYLMFLFLFHWAMLIGWMSFLRWGDFGAIAAFARRGRRIAINVPSVP
jgi:vitamin K-dependent gamma-carboxylase-like protein